MRILILNADYPKFLRAHYQARPELREAGYGEQMAARNASLFGVADFYSRALQAHGHEAQDIHVNNAWLQRAWAREHGLPLPDATEDATQPSARPFPGRAIAKAVLGPIVRPLRARMRDGWLTPDEREILAAQIEVLRPDIILNQDMSHIGNAFLKTMRGNTRLIVGQLAAALPERKVFDAYDLVVSSLPNLVAWFRKQGVKAEYNPLAFEPSILQAWPEPAVRDIPLSFVGSLSPEHEGRIALLETLARQVPLKVWGNAIERLPRSSVLHACYQGEAWGRGMYDVLRRSQITLNRHIDLAEDWANNMRLYEATGMGALLLTDAKKNLADLFVPGEHVASYDSVDACVAQIKKYLGDDSARAAIAEGGQRHVIEAHNYQRRMGEFLGLIAPFVR